MGDHVEINGTPNVVPGTFGQNIKTADLFENMSESNVLDFIKNKLETWSSLVDSNPLVTEDEKNSIKGNFQLFEQQVKNNKVLFDKYQGNEGLFFRKILDKIPEKNTLNQTENIDNIEMKFIGGNFVIEIPDIDMDKYFGESFNGGTVIQPGLEIDGIPIIPIVVRKNAEKKNEIICHELQHFYNKFLIKHSEKVLLNYLADETIAQTILGSRGQNAEDWKIFLVNCMSRGVQDGDLNSYTFGNRFKTSAENQIALNQQILENLDNVDVARELRDAGIENYADILAITPISKWKDLRDLYLKN